MERITKLGAAGLAVAAAFAVALAVLVSAFPATADAAVRDSASGADMKDVTKYNGDTVYISNSEDNAYVTFAITAIGAADASFTHSSATDNGRSITCRAGGSCDADTTAGKGGVQVALKIADDSGAGAIIVTQTTISSTPKTDVDTIEVMVAQVPTKLSLKLGAESIDSGQGSGAMAGSTDLTIQLTDASGDGIAGETLTVVSTHALLSSSATTRTGSQLSAFSSTNGVLAGTITTSTDNDDADMADGAGYAIVQVMGGGSAGVSTITVTLGSVTASVDIVLHGPVTKITAEPEQSAIEAGGTTFIVVTATDSAGNHVAGHNVMVKSGASGVVGPSAAATKVEVVNTMNKDSDGDGTVDSGDLPSCGTQTADATNMVFASMGTNAAAGQCVLHVDAGSDAGTSDDASRGTHTITIVGPKSDGSADVVVEIQVGGAPATIETDAPARIDPSDEMTVNITVLDDAGVRVGGVAIEVLQTAGDGAIIAEAGSMTSDGRAKFTYLAPSTPGVAEFLVRTKSGSTVTAKLPIIVQIAEEAPPEPPDPPMVEAPSLTPAPVGANTLTVFSGGTVDELADAVTAACGNPSAAAWVTNAAGEWVGLIPAAPALVNVGFLVHFGSVVPDNTPLLVTNCD